MRLIGYLGNFVRQSLRARAGNRAWGLATIVGRRRSVWIERVLPRGLSRGILGLMYQHELAMSLQKGVASGSESAHHGGSRPRWGHSPVQLLQVRDRLGFGGWAVRGLKEDGSDAGAAATPRLWEESVINEAPVRTWDPEAWPRCFRCHSPFTSPEDIVRVRHIFGYTQTFGIARHTRSQPIIGIVKVHPSCMENDDDVV